MVAEKSRETKGCVDKEPARSKDKEFNPISNYNSCLPWLLGLMSVTVEEVDSRLDSLERLISFTTGSPGCRDDRMWDI